MFKYDKNNAIKVLSTVLEKPTAIILAEMGLPPEVATMAGKALSVVISGFKFAEQEQVNLSKRDLLADYIRLSLFNALEGIAFETPELREKARKQLLNIFTTDNTVAYPHGSKISELLEGTIRDVLAHFNDEAFDETLIESIVMNAMKEVENEIENSPRLMEFYDHINGKDTNRTVKAIEADIKELGQDTRETKQTLQELHSEFRDFRDGNTISPTKKPTSAVATNIDLPAKHKFFTGRKGELSDIETALGQTGRVKVSGPGGFGKSQIAYAYAHKYRKEYERIWVVNAISSFSLKSCYHTMALGLGLTSARECSDDEFRLLLSRLMQWFKGKEKFLIIYDNGEGLTHQQDGEISWQDYLPPGLSSGHVIVTTQAPKAIPEVDDEVPVEEFDKDDAISFITKRLKGRLDVSPSDAKLLAAKLGYLPLALEAAAAFIHINMRHTISSYVEEWETRKTEMLNQSEGIITGYKLTVLNTWEMSIAAIKLEDARQIFNICAYFAPDDIPLDMLIKGRDKLPEPLCHTLGPDNGAKLDALLRELGRYSLVRVEDRDGWLCLSLHGLLQEVMRLRFGGGLEWLCYGFEVVYEAFDFGDYGTRGLREAFGLFLPHALGVVGCVEGSVEGDDDAQEKVARVYHAAGFGLNELGQYDNALKWYFKSLAINENMLGKEHPHIATTYNNIATVYDNQGKYTDALEWYFKALPIKENVLGKEHSSTATTYNNIAGVYYRQGKYTDALVWYFKALPIYEKVLGKEHPHTAATYNNIAGVYDIQGKYTDALEWYFKALSIDENVLGNEHPLTAITYNNIAMVYDNHGKYIDALEWYFKALAINEKVLGKEHPDTATTYNNIAGVYDNQGKYTDALVWYFKTLPIFEKVLGKEHPHTAITYNNIAMAYNSQDKYTDALEWYLKSLRILLPALGTTHPTTITVLSNTEATYTSANLPEPFDQWLELNLK